MRLRNKGIMIIVLILLLSGCTKNVTKEQINPTVADEKHIYTLEETMEVLVSDDFKGRLTGTEGNDKAVLYIENRFREMGLDPYKDISYLQGYNQMIFHPDEQFYSLTMEYEDKTKEELKLGVDYMYKNHISDGDISLAITSDINDEGISEKILLLDDIDNLGMALEKAGGLIVSRDEFSISAFITKSKVPIIEVKPKVFDKIVSNKATVVNIKSEHKGRKIEAYNVIGKIPGKNNKQALVISAHFDHLGWRGDAIFPGAVDNASGTAVLLDVASRLKEYSDINQFKMDILIVGFNGEESGLLGSQAFASEIKDDYDSIYNINIDCVGSKSSGKIAFDNDNHLASSLIAELKQCLKRNNIDYEDRYYGMSDHQSFINENIPAITIGQGDLKLIHREYDNIEDIDFEYLKRISNAVYDFVLVNNGKIFDSSGENSVYEGPSVNTWKRAIERAEELKKEMNVQFDEEFYFKLDGYEFRASGNKKLRSQEEVNKYYPNIIIVNNLSKYDFHNIVIDRWNYHTSSIRGYETSYEGEVSEIKKRNMDINKTGTVVMEYIWGKKVLKIEIINLTNITFGSDPYTEEIKLDGVRENYTLLKDKDGNDYWGFYVEIMKDSDFYKLDFSLHTTTPYGEEYIELYSATKEELINLIDEIEAQISIEEILDNIIR